MSLSFSFSQMLNPADCGYGDQGPQPQPQSHIRRRAGGGQIREDRPDSGPPLWVFPWRHEEGRGPFRGPDGEKGGRGSDTNLAVGSWRIGNHTIPSRDEQGV